MDCLFCGSTLILSGDFNAREHGIKCEGIVKILTCPSCGAYWEGVLLEEEEE